MPESDVYWIGSRGQALAANVSIAARRALAMIGLADRRNIPPSFVPMAIESDRPVLAVGSVGATRAWARLAMARETPRGLEPPVGYITAAGFPDNQAVQTALFDGCKAWFVEQGAKTVIALMSDSIMDDRGIAYDQPSRNGATYGLPVNPAYYVDAMKRWGFDLYMDMFEYDITFDRITHPPDRLVAYAKRSIKDCRVVTVSGERIIDHLPQIVEIYNDAHAENDAFVPLRLSDVEPVAHRMAKFVPHDSAILIFSGERPVGLLVAIPDFNQLALTNPLTLLFAQKAIANIRRYRGILFGVARDHRKNAVEVLLFQTFRENMRKYCDTFIIGWTIETNTPLINIIMRKMAGIKINDYAMMRLDL